MIVTLSEVEWLAVRKMASTPLSLTDFRPYLITTTVTLSEVKGLYYAKGASTPLSLTFEFLFA